MEIEPAPLVRGPAAALERPGLHNISPAFLRTRLRINWCWSVAESGSIQLLPEKSLSFEFSVGHGGSGTLPMHDEKQRHSGPIAYPNRRF